MFSILLRALLTISLVLNGSGYAVASMHMHKDHMDMAAPAPVPVVANMANTEPPCHQDPGVGAASSAATLSDASLDTAPMTPKHPSPDCCKSGACRCACVHQIQVTIAAHFIGYTLTEHAGVVHPLKRGHAAPALPHLIRPPIG